jgi:hypothetical protein
MVPRVTEANPLTPADVRTAAATLKAAIDAHLEACEHSIGEHDPEVQAAYEALHRAALAYDDLLYDVHREVTPWEFAHGPRSEVETEVGDLHTLALLVRRDYRVDDFEALISVGRKAYAQSWPAARAEWAYRDVTSAGRAVSQMIHTYGPDGVMERAEGAGLHAYGGTVWVLGLRPHDHSLESDNPFQIADPTAIVYRLDEVFED